jgi:hypothetical protein
MITNNSYSVCFLIPSLLTIYPFILHYYTILNTTTTPQKLRQLLLSIINTITIITITLLLLL